MSTTEVQDRLEAALQKARWAGDRELATRVRELGEQFARLLLALARLSGTHALGNDVFHQPAARCSSTLRELVAELGSVHLIVIDQQVQVNDVRVRFEGLDDAGERLEAWLGARSSGGLSFHRPLDADQLLSLVFAIGEEGDLQRQLDRTGLASVEVLPPAERVLKAADRLPENARFADDHRRALSLVADLYDQLARSRQPRVLPLRRTVMALVDHGRADPGRLLLTARVREAPRHAAHGVAVCQLAIALGMQLDLDLQQLCDLGIAGLVHDLGYAPVDGREAGLHDHGPRALEVLLRERGFHAARVQRVLACLDHHADLAEGPGLLARVLHVADDYDTLTHPGGPHTPPDGLERMVGAAGRAYDPVIVQLLVNLLGRWPPGSSVRLANGAVGRVISGARDPVRWDRPVVVVTRMPDGRRPPKAVRIDTATQLRVVGSA